MNAPTAVKELAKRLYHEDGGVLPFHRLKTPEQNAWFDKARAQLFKNAQRQAHPNSTLPKLTDLPKVTEIPLGNEHHRAAWWRKNVVKLKHNQLAGAIGLRTQTVRLMERGVTSRGTRIKPHVWHRYKQACFAVHAKFFGWVAGETFDWDERREFLND
jgi:hypothetical protein